MFEMQDGGSEQPEAPENPDLTPNAPSPSAGARSTSFYGCAMSARSSTHSWLAGAGWAALMALRRRATFAARRGRREPRR
jgi:hypothetical protein